MTVTAEKPHVHGEWTDDPLHADCQLVAWCCIDCGKDRLPDPPGKVSVWYCRCGSLTFAPLWRLAART